MPVNKGPYVDPNLGDLDSLGDNELRRLIDNRLPIILPWHNEKTVRLGTCLHSSRLSTTKSPWQEDDSPFLLAHLYRVPPVLTREYGTVASFKSTSTSLRRDTRDHLSLAFGLGVGVSCFMVSVKGHYDRDVQENKDSNKASIQASIRAGSVELATQPRLTNKAIAVVKYGGGIPAFERRYGDYYVAGYRLGGDTAMLMSSSSYKTKVTETIGVTVTVEVLFWEISDHWETDFKFFASGRSLKLLGYDTLGARNWNESASGNAEVAELFVRSKDIALSTQSLGERLSGILDDMGLHHGDELTMEQCDKLTKAGVVVELVLMPVRGLRHVLEWAYQDNII